MICIYCGIEFETYHLSDRNICNECLNKINYKSNKAIEEYKKTFVKILENEIIKEC